MTVSINRNPPPLGVGRFKKHMSDEFREEVFEDICKTELENPHERYDRSFKDEG